MVGEIIYWNCFGSSCCVQFGFSSGIKCVSYSLVVFCIQEMGLFGCFDIQFMVFVSIFLGGSVCFSQVYVNVVSLQYGDLSLNIGIFGYLDEVNVFNYSVQVNYSKDGGNFGSVGLGWDMFKVKLFVNYSQGCDNKQINLGVSGLVVVYLGGVIFGQLVGEMFGLVEVLEVGGVGFDGYFLVCIDGCGYVVFFYM